MISGSEAAHCELLRNELITVHQTSLKWLKVAFEADVSVQKQVKALIFATADVDPFRNSTCRMHFEVAILGQIYSRKLFCNQIIRKIIKKVIERELIVIHSKMKEADIDPSCLIPYEAYLKELIPHKICFKSISKIERLYNQALILLVEIQDQLDFVLNPPEILY